MTPFEIVFLVLVVGFLEYHAFRIASDTAYKKGVQDEHTRCVMRNSDI